MKIKPFEAGIYDDNLIVVCNPQNEKQELFTEEEFEIIRFIKKNEQQELLALLLPNIGIAKRHHIVVCLRVLDKLKKLNLIDFLQSFGKRESTETSTLDMQVKRERVRLEGLNSLATTLVSISSKVLGKLGVMPLVAAILLLCVCSLLFLPVDAAEKAFASGEVSYMKTLLLMYLFMSGGFIFRTFTQAAFLHSLKREGRYPRFYFYGPFITAKIDKRGVNLEGFQRRVQLALLGAVSPMAFSAFFVLIGLTNILSATTVFLAVCSGIAVSLFLLCPFLPLDGAHVISILLYRNELLEKTTKKIRTMFIGKLFEKREVLLLGLFSLGWTFLWIDTLRVFVGFYLQRISYDLHDELLNKLSANVFVAVLVIVFLAPLLALLVPILRDWYDRRKKRIVLEKEQVRESLTFEERMSALERVPLFAGLNDQERLSLINEMQPKYFKADSFLMHQGELGKEFFVLAKGTAHAFYVDPQGKKYTLSDFREGDAFGEIALIDDVPRMASVLTDQGCLALVLPKDGFNRFAASLGSSDKVKTMIRLTSFFRRHPLFSRLSPRDQAMLIDNFQFDNLNPGDEIIGSENQENFYLIYSGKIRVDTGDDASDTFLEPDDCFGYANAFQVRYFASEGAGILKVPKTQFDTLIWGKLVERPELFF